MDWTVEYSCDKAEAMGNPEGYEEGYLKGFRCGISAARLSFANVRLAGTLGSWLNGLGENPQDNLT